MLKIEILGPDNAESREVEESARMAALMLGVRTRIERITGRAEQVSVYLPAIPGLVVNDRLVSAGRVPHEFEVMGWMAEALENA